MDLASTTFAVTDIETTGRSPERHRITEVAVVFLRGGEVLDERSTLINPGQYIPRQIQQLTGISNGMVASAPPSEAVLPQIREWFREDPVFTAHNLQFDHRFLQQSFLRHAITPLETPLLCTLRIARRLLPARRGFSLGRLASYLGVRINDRHRALGDARATARILALLLEQAREEHDCTDLEQLLALQYRPTTAFRSPTPRISELAAQARDLPGSPGIYRFYGRGGTLLYIGKANSLRQRVSGYFRPSGAETPKKSEMIRKVRTIEHQVVPSELSALLLESKLIKEYQPKYNVAGKRLRRYAFIRLDRGERFPMPEVVTAVLPDGAEYFGPFRNRDEASMLVETLQKIYPLRECEGRITPTPTNIPCLYHGIGRCSAPCAGLVTEPEYHVTVEAVASVLNGSEDGITGVIRDRMQRAAEALDFEMAAELRDRLAEVERVFVWKQSFSESVNRNNLAVLIPEGAAVRLYVLLHGRLHCEVRIGSRFPHRKLAEVIGRVLKRIDQSPDIADPISIDEVRLIAGYLRRSRETRQVVPIDDHDSCERVVARLSDAVATLRHGSRTG